MYKRRGQRRYIVRLIKKEKTENSAVWPPAIPYEALSTPIRPKYQQTRWSATGGVLCGVFAMIGFSGQHTQLDRLMVYFLGFATFVNTVTAYRLWAAYLHSRRIDTSTKFNQSTTTQDTGNP